MTWPLAVVPRADGVVHRAPSCTFWDVAPPDEVTGPELPANEEVTGLLVLVVAELLSLLLHAPASAKTTIATHASRS
jgi:hypothetical protein